MFILYSELFLNDDRILIINLILILLKASLITKTKKQTARYSQAADDQHINNTYTQLIEAQTKQVIFLKTENFITILKTYFPL